MIVVATSNGFTVTEQDDFRTFHVEVGESTPEEVGERVAASTDVSPHPTPDHVWVDIEFLRRELGTASNPDRAAGLAGMLAYAASKGWQNEEGTAVAAHIVRPD